MNIPPPEDLPENASQPQQPVRKRRRTQLACNSCRQRKTACNGDRPSCSSCIRRGVQDSCSYEEATVGSKASVNAGKALITDNSKPNVPFRTVSHSISSPDAATGNAPSPGNVGGLAMVSDIESQDSLYGGSSTIALVSQVRQAASDQAASMNATGIPSPDNAAQTNGDIEILHNQDFANFILPPRQQADDFLNCYWEFVHPSTQHANRCWNMVGLAIRTAQGLGLNTENNIHRTNQLNIEIRRRVWYSSMTFGRPTMIRTGSWDVPEPAIIDDQYLSSDSQGVQQSGLHSRMYLFVYSLRLFDIMDEILSEFYVLQGGKSGSNSSKNFDPWSVLTRTHLTLTTRTLNIRLQGKVNPARQSRAWTSERSRNWIAFAAATILLAAQLSPLIEANLSTDHSFEKSWTSCIKILEHHKVQIQSAERATTILKGLKEKIQARKPQEAAANSKAKHKSPTTKYQRQQIIPP
ncbi:hypothetical protein SS1G_14383 [Sclerotinia sclerotiorum 1980 UF-70]|uniref:Zn(2)-C6 fungal-type domain-containing protein n=1 Tax=Sclerotinia sclerotiorum (strain ATCC 18683 / 1980 / Ss-1) TaxID=665079 RepID=A7F9V2_SCLS1|nr:hypothetical protein SS1G_14383 [Sclerotinia sclerotiorum 1980 UF-70]EDO00513.1 hypothetical protein SS1G_14383 [Sclerotinia sclerotiorum 1980 UF-70]